MDDTLEQMIERHEGCRLTPYLDSLGVQTIGIGHNLQRPFSRKAIEQQFRDDLNETINDCTHAFPWFTELSKYRQWAMVDLCFNLGLTRLLGFKKFLKAMELGDYETAANELLDSLLAKQLKTRVRELADLIRGTEQV